MSDPDTALTEDVLRLARAGSVVKNDDELDTRVVILAGGRGRRLEPYTSVLPKPLPDREPVDPRDPGPPTHGRRPREPHVLRRLSVAPDSRGVRERSQAERKDHVGQRAGAARHGRATASRRGPRRDVPRDERRPVDDDRLPRAPAPPSRGRERGHDRDPPATSPARLRRDAPRLRERKRATGRLRGEAGDDLEREHRHLRVSSRPRWSSSPPREPSTSRTWCAPLSSVVWPSAATSTTGSGSTSGATRTTSRRLRCGRAAKEWPRSRTAPSRLGVVPATSSDLGGHMEVMRTGSGEECDARGMLFVDPGPRPTSVRAKRQFVSHSRIGLDALANASPAS